MIQPQDREKYWRRYWSVMKYVAPNAQSAQDAFFDRLLQVLPEGRWLDAGCGRTTFPSWRSESGIIASSMRSRYFGCDLDLGALKDRSANERTPLCAATLDRLPYGDQSFSLVSANMVFEHLRNPRETASELARVTKECGKILIHTVNSRHYLALLAQITPFRFHRWIVPRVEGRAAIDVYPTEYRANTEARLRRVFEEAGCRKVRGGAISDLPMCVTYPVVFWLALTWGLVERLLGRLPGVRAFFQPNLLVEFERVAPSVATLVGGSAQPTDNAHQRSERQLTEWQSTSP